MIVMYRLIGTIGVILITSLLLVALCDVGNRKAIEAIMRGMELWFGFIAVTFAISVIRLLWIEC